MSRYDIEDLLFDVAKILKANLNAKIAAIEAEKIAAGRPATGIGPIDTTDNLGYILQSWSDANFNTPISLFYGIEDVKAEGAGPATIHHYTVFVEVVMVDSGMDRLGNTRINRYTRAVQEVLQENYDRLPSAAKIKIETVRPTSFKLDQNTSEEIKVGGVSITTALA